MMMGVLIFFLIVPILGFICATINYFIINKFKLPKYMAYLLPSLSILFIFIHAIKLHMILFFMFHAFIPRIHIMIKNLYKLINYAALIGFAPNIVFAWPMFVAPPLLTKTSMYEVGKHGEIPA